ncbi:MAG TPA: DUF4142 domain-containing protein [Brevundimonas sp.]|jgi:putative membrane protein
MKDVVLAASAAAAVLLAACSTMPTGQAAPIAEAAMAQSAPPAMEFVRMAGASDQYEIQSSQLVLQSTQDPELRRFAQMMVDHHTMTTATVMRAAQTAGLTPSPPTLDAEKTEMIRQLQGTSNEARDALYKQQQVMAHRQALMLHASYAKNGDAPSLKTAAASAVPIVSRHYNMIMAMAGDASSPM